MTVHIGVLKETAPGERRVALVPDAVARLVGAGHEVVVEADAGAGAYFADGQYADAGADVGDRTKALAADAVLVVRRPRADDIDTMQKGAVLIGFLAPYDEPPVAPPLAAAGVTAFAVELIPRSTRAQSMDALSSQTTVAGYVGVLLAATRLPRFLPMLTTPAGTVAPAKVLVLGAGVAGLQAIATARRLGALVSAFDTRAAAAEQVRSLGAKFLDLGVGGDDAETAGGYARELTPEELAAQTARLGDAIAAFDAVICTALVQGKPAPRLVAADVVARMRPGSVIVDLAAERGGNCALTEPGTEVVRHGVTIVGLLDLPSMLPVNASEMYARNLSSFLSEIVRDGELVLDLDNEIVRGACLTYDGEVRTRVV